MEREIWLSRWQEDRIGFNLEAPHASLVRYFSDLGLSQQPRVFVPLCGKTVDMVWLAEQGCTVVGVEFSLKACEDFFAENDLKHHKKKVGPFDIFVGDQITLFCGDFLT